MLETTGMGLWKAWSGGRKIITLLCVVVVTFITRKYPLDCGENASLEKNSMCHTTFFVSSLINDLNYLLCVAKLLNSRTGQDLIIQVLMDPIIWPGRSVGFKFGPDYWRGPCTAQDLFGEWDNYWICVAARQLLAVQDSGLCGPSSWQITHALQVLVWGSMRQPYDYWPPGIWVSEDPITGESRTPCKYLSGDLWDNQTVTWICWIWVPVNHYWQVLLDPLSSQMITGIRLAVSRISSAGVLINPVKCYLFFICAIYLYQFFIVIPLIASPFTLH